MQLFEEERPGYYVVGSAETDHGTCTIEVVSVDDVTENDRRQISELMFWGLMTEGYPCPDGLREIQDDPDVNHVLCFLARGQNGHVASFSALVLRENVHGVRYPQGCMSIECSVTDDGTMVTDEDDYEEIGIDYRRQGLMSAIYRTILTQGLEFMPTNDDLQKCPTITIDTLSSREPVVYGAEAGIRAQVNLRAMFMRLAYKARWTAEHPVVEDLLRPIHVAAIRVTDDSMAVQIQKAEAGTYMSSDYSRPLPVLFTEVCFWTGVHLRDTEAMLDKMRSLLSERGIENLCTDGSGITIRVPDFEVVEEVRRALIDGGMRDVQDVRTNLMTYGVCRPMVVEEQN